MTETHTLKNTAQQKVARLDKVDSRPAKNRALKRFLKHRVAIAAVIVLTIITIISVGAPLFAPFEYDKIDLRAAGLGPSPDHWFGTDRVGRDIWSRTLYGGRVSLAVGVGATVIATSIGTVLGAISGFYRGWIDTLIMRITDTVMTFPSIVIMLTLAALLPRSIWNIVLIIGGLSWPSVARLVRAQFMSIRENEYVMAARCLGVRDRSIIVYHILPNVFAPLVALITFSVGSAILTEAGLSFLGLGVPPPMPSWGNMLESARNLDILQNLPWMWIPPAMMTVITVLCVNFIGDGIRDAIDPRLVL
ncbi:MAG: oligopeptide ABC transporter permease [Chloroflexota bacterium]